MTATWPTHADGTNKTVGEMTPEEKRVVFLSAAERFAERGDSIGERTFRRLAERATA
jgi:hypothetical protein